MKTELQNKGYTIINSLYTVDEIDEIIQLIEDSNNAGKFGVREFLFLNPKIREKVFNKKLKQLILSISPNCKKSIKSIYFDKPPNSNWIVNWHQDLTINLSNKEDVPNYRNWRKTKERFITQPSTDFLESIFTVRLHLDECTVNNGALRVIDKSHRKGVVDIKEWMKTKVGKESICEVQKGGVLIMKPLILHSSKRTENEMNRRVIHIEFTHKELPKGLKWKEKVEFN